MFDIHSNCGRDTFSCFLLTFLFFKSPSARALFLFVGKCKREEQRIFYGNNKIDSLFFLPRPPPRMRIKDFLKLFFRLPENYFSSKRSTFFLSSHVLQPLLPPLLFVSLPCCTLNREVFVCLGLVGRRRRRRREPSILLISPTPSATFFDSH